MMRTTVAFEDDVLERLRRESRIRKESFRGTLNKVIRDGLALAEHRRNTATPFRVKPRSIGLKQGLNYDSISSLLAVGDGEDSR